MMFKKRSTKMTSLPGDRLTAVQVLKLSGGPVLLGLGLLALSIAAAGALAWAVVGSGPHPFDIGHRSAQMPKVTPATLPGQGA
jgi:hypothetical protein